MDQNIFMASCARGILYQALKSDILPFILTLRLALMQPVLEQNKLKIMNSNNKGASNSLEVHDVCIPFATRPTEAKLSGI